MLSFESIDIRSRKRSDRIPYGKISITFLLFLMATSIVAHGFRFFSQGTLAAYDSSILGTINAFSSPFLDVAALLVTYSGNLGVILTVSILLAAAFFRRKAYDAAMQIILTVGGALLLNNILKIIFQRERPELWQLITHEITYSFPSGHALLSMSLAAVVALLWHKAGYAWLIVSLAGAYTLLVGLSRLYLGVHYPSDVVAGWIIGFGWATSVAFMLGTLRIRKGSLHYTQ